MLQFRGTKLKLSTNGGHEVSLRETTSTRAPSARSMGDLFALAREYVLLLR